jgi:NADPH-dependent 2,4-dienoyl-CoA reductase/sulfur reductase-like enzyme
MADRLVVIGGNAGGMAAAMQARRRQPYLEIVALEKGSWTSYSTCGIPYLVAGDVDSLERLVARSPQEFRDQHRIDVRLQHEVVGVDLAERRLDVRDHARQRTIQIGFDQLHIATGARPLRPELPGIDGDSIKGVQTLDDAKALLEHARTSQCKEVVVVGGGYIGLEMAEAFLRWGAKVTLIEGSSHVMRTLDPDMSAPIVKAMLRMGIDVQLGTPVDGFEPGVVLTPKGSVRADLVVLGLGVVPNSELAAEAGIATGSREAIAVNRRQETSAEGVYAAGDCAETFHRVSQRPIHVALGTVANKQGRVAGINLGGGYATFPGVVGTAVTKVCSLEIGRTGLTEAEAKRAGFDYAVATIQSTTRAGYFPGTKPITVKVLAEQGTGRLLGGQIVGEEGAAKRIDVLATCLTAGFSVFDVIDLDLAYAPPFGSVWDPIHIAARKAAEALEPIA